MEIDDGKGQKGEGRLEGEVLYLKHNEWKGAEAKEIK
jgi:hypothetical protein